MTTSVNESEQQDSIIDDTTDDDEDTNSQCTSHSLDQYNQVLKFPEIDRSVGTINKAICYFCATVQIEIPTSNCPSCGGSDMYVRPKKGIWVEDEDRREQFSIKGNAIEPLILQTIETSNLHNATSKFLSVVARCYGAITEKEISTYVDSRTHYLLLYGISTVQQIATKIFTIHGIYFERAYSIDHSNQTITFHPVRMTFLERQIMIEAATYWLQNEYKLSELWINLHRRTNNFINKTWKMA